MPDTTLKPTDPLALRGSERLREAFDKVLALSQQFEEDERDRQFALADALLAVCDAAEAEGIPARYVVRRFASERRRSESTVYGWVATARLFGPAERERFQALSWAHFYMASFRAGRRGECLEARRERAVAALEWAQDNDASAERMVNVLMTWKGESDPRQEVREIIAGPDALPESAEEQGRDPMLSETLLPLACPSCGSDAVREDALRRVGWLYENFTLTRKARA